MTEFISKYIDLLALALTLLLPLIVTIKLKRKRGKKLRAVPLYLFVFGPSGILAFICCHLFENTYRAIVAALDGAFRYNFHFYSLILLGVVVAYLGVQLFIACRRKCLQEQNVNKPYFIWVSLQLLFTVPLIPIIPIAAVPLICCCISLIGFAFVRRKIIRITSGKQEPSYALTTSS